MSITPLRSYRATLVPPGTPFGQSEAKACAACAHHLEGACMHPASPRDHVTGEATRCCWMRQEKNRPDGICGPAGRLFEPLLSAHVGHAHSAQVAAILSRGRRGIAGTAFTNNAAALEFWKGYTEAARDLINGIGALAAAKDELTSSGAQTLLQTAGACLPERTKAMLIK